MQECDAGSDGELGFGEVEGELADVLYAEGGGDLGVVHWEANFFVGFSPADLEGSLG